MVFAFGLWHKMNSDTFTALTQTAAWFTERRHPENGHVVTFGNKDFVIIADFESGVVFDACHCYDMNDVFPAWETMSLASILRYWQARDLSESGFSEFLKDRRQAESDWNGR